MTDVQTTLFKFVDAGDAAGDSGRDAPAPTQNAAEIERLADLVERLADQVGTLAELEQRPAEYSAEDTDSDPRGMYQ